MIKREPIETDQEWAARLEDELFQFEQLYAGADLERRSWRSAFSALRAGIAIGGGESKMKWIDDLFKDVLR